MDEETKPGAIRHLELAKAFLDLFGSLFLIAAIAYVFFRVFNSDFPGGYDGGDERHTRGEEWKPYGWKPDKNRN